MIAETSMKQYNRLIALQKNMIWGQYRKKVDIGTAGDAQINWAWNIHIAQKTTGSLEVV